MTALPIVFSPVHYCLYLAVDVSRPSKSFRVDDKGQFVEMANLEDLVHSVEQLTLEADAAAQVRYLVVRNSHTIIVVMC